MNFQVFAHLWKRENIFKVLTKLASFLVIVVRRMVSIFGPVWKKLSSLICLGTVEVASPVVVFLFLDFLFFKCWAAALCSFNWFEFSNSKLHREAPSLLCIVKVHRCSAFQMADLSPKIVSKLKYIQ